LVFDEPIVSVGDACAEGDLWGPDEGFDFLDVQKLPRGAVGFAGIEFEGTVEAEDIADRFG